MLQELYEEEDQPVHTVEGFNTWFQDNREVISRLRGEVNDQSLSRIWIGFLQYYTENFKFDKTTIQIRHKCHLTTFEKEWTSKCISIEDPFELTHNLGCGVSRKMANYIVKVLQRARGIFGRFNYQMFAENHWEFNLGLFAESLFSSHLLTDGDEVPNDRCCRICGKIGHFVKDCPLSRRNKNKTQNQNGTNDNMPAQKCYACNESGHFAKVDIFLTRHHQCYFVFGILKDCLFRNVLTDGMDAKTVYMTSMSNKAQCVAHVKNLIPTITVDHLVIETIAECITTAIWDSIVLFKIQ